MKDLILHPQTRHQVEEFVKAPSHALLLAGASGSGKKTLALGLAEEVLQLPANSFAQHPYGLIITAETGKAIGIEAVRKLDQFLALKVPGRTTFDRIAVIEDAQLLTIEAQNALLKTLEEPPIGTLLILTVNQAQTMLPTIRSRAQLIVVGRLEQEAVKAYFADRNFDEKEVAQAYAISGGLPGLMQALLSETDHPLLQATGVARQILSQSAHERLLAVDELAKQRTLAADMTFILQQMAHVSLQSARGPAAKKWQVVLTASYEAGEALARSAQPKLTLTRLMLSL